MGRRCSICLHADRESIDSSLIRGEPLRSIAARHGLSATALHRHKNAHLPKALARVHERAMDAWAYRHGIQLEFIRPRKPIENRFIESFNGRLRDEFLNVEVFFSIPDVQAKLERWRVDYNQHRPHSSLQDQTPSAFALASEGKRRRGTDVSPVSLLEAHRTGISPSPP